MAEGRQEIHDVWIGAFEGKKVDNDMLKDSVSGALQLGFNSEPSEICTA